VVTPDPARGTFAAEVLDAAGNRYLQIRGYRTVTVSDNFHAEPLKALQAFTA